MDIQIRGREIVVTAALQTRVARRLGFALRRFAGRIGRVTVRFSEANAHGSSVDRRCQIDVTLLHSGEVRAESSEANATVALDRASSRISRAVARAVEREHGFAFPSARAA